MAQVAKVWRKRWAWTFERPAWRPRRLQELLEAVGPQGNAGTQGADAEPPVTKSEPVPNFLLTPLQQQSLLPLNPALDSLPLGVVAVEVASQPLSVGVRCGLALQNGDRGVNAVRVLLHLRWSTCSAHGFSVAARAFCRQGR